MLKVCLEMKFLKYGFVGLLLLASALFIVIPTQSQVIFGQGTNTTNTTDSEIPAFDGQNPGFTPKSEDGAAPPPPPADATTVDELPKETLVKDPDSEALSIANRTEILEMLPANSTKIIKFVDEDLKNSTGVGLAPTDVLDKLTSNPNDNKSILSLATPEEVKQIESVVVNTTSAPSEEDDEVPVANATSEEEDQAAVGEENATSTSTNETDVTGGETGNEEDKAAVGEENATSTSTNETYVTGGETGNEEDKAAVEENATSTNTTDNTGDQEQQADNGDEQTNITNATSAIEPNVTSSVTGDEQGSTEDQKQQKDNRDEQGSTEDQKQQADNGEEQQAQTGEEPPLPPITNATNATAAQAPGMLNASNITGTSDQAGSEDDGNGASDESGDE
ncbi:MAG TPA: hypothetical protein VLD84_03635 [Nitrososphaeraceae archaeon]|nr:hypothetical protein [Nitrososphaeraceae archaeon]